MAEKMEINPAAEFQALPLEFMVAAPLIAAVKAQALAAQATMEFIKGFKDANVSFSVARTKEDNNSEKVTLDVPLLSIVPVPHLQIDSLSVDFKFEISQTFTDRNTREKGVETEVATGGALSPWIKGSLRGNISSKSSEESTMNRSGQLEISLRASEAPIPEGLSRILNILAKTVKIEPTGAAPAGGG